MQSLRSGGQWNVPGIRPRRRQHQEVFCEALADLGGPVEDNVSHFAEMATLGDLAPNSDLADALAAMERSVKASGDTGADTNDLWANPEFEQSVDMVADFW